MKSTRDITGIAASIVPVAATATANGAGVDTLGYDAALIEISTGAFSGTAPTATLKVQESADNTTFTDVADTDLIGVTGNTSGFAQLASTIKKVDYIGALRYVRVALTAIGGSSTPTVTISANVILGRATYLPVS